MRAWDGVYSEMITRKAKRELRRANESISKPRLNRRYRAALKRWESRRYPVGLLDWRFCLHYAPGEAEAYCIGKVQELKRAIIEMDRRGLL